MRVRVKLIWYVGALVLLPVTASAQDCLTLSPSAQALLPWATTPEKPAPFVINGAVRSWPADQKSTVTFRVLAPSLAGYARDSMRFWAHVASCGNKVVTAVEVPASDTTAMNTWRLGKVAEFPCPTLLLFPFSNGAVSPWATQGCDLVTYTTFDYVFSSASRYLSLHEKAHDYVYPHKSTGVFAKKQTCVWNANVTPEQNAEHPCWLTPAEREVVRFLHWSRAGQ